MRDASSSSDSCDCYKLPKAGAIIKKTFVPTLSSGGKVQEGKQCVRAGKITWPWLLLFCFETVSYYVVQPDLEMLPRILSWRLLSVGIKQMPTPGLETWLSG